MTTKIYSRLDPTKLLHMIVREVPEGRTDLCPNEQFLQCAALRLKAGTTFKPHQHNWNLFKGERLAQENWIVIKGCVQVFYYDTDGALLESYWIHPGEMSMTFEGGHNYLILSDDTVVYETKTGPYISQEHDKTFI